MKNNRFLVTICSFLLMSILVSCKTHYEKVRSSNDPKLLLSEAKKYYEAKDYYKAQSLYELVIPTYRGRTEAEEIFYNFAYSHYYTGQYILAAHYFKNFASTFYNSDKREECDFMSAYSNYQMSPTFKLDQSHSEKAIEGLQLFMNTYPESERIVECNNLIDEIRKKMEDKAFSQAKLYFNQNHFESAVRSFENLLKDFPETSKAEEVRYLIAKSTYEFASNSVFSKRQERYNVVLNKCKDFRKKFPTSKFDNEIERYIENAQNEINKIKNG